eukprot:GILJ01010905.1.p1 GENE.GILJ01010905.1~~GILJ01010905.1.p1  ORF type:complete len:292 (+),score=22.42 GILJ01010905.1:239-1114(+)
MSAQVQSSYRGQPIENISPVQNLVAQYGIHSDRETEPPNVYKRQPIKQPSPRSKQLAKTFLSDLKSILTAHESGEVFIVDKDTGAISPQAKEARRTVRVVSCRLYSPPTPKAQTCSRGTSNALSSSLRHVQHEHRDRQKQQKSVSAIEARRDHHRDVMEWLQRRTPCSHHTSSAQRPRFYHLSPSAGDFDIVKGASSPGPAAYINASPPKQHRSITFDKAQRPWPKPKEGPGPDYNIKESYLSKRAVCDKTSSVAVSSPPDPVTLASVEACGSSGSHGAAIQRSPARFCWR